MCYVAPLRPSEAAYWLSTHRHVWHLKVGTSESSKRAGAGGCSEAAARRAQGSLVPPTADARTPIPARDLNAHGPLLPAGAATGARPPRAGPGRAWGVAPPLGRAGPPPPGRREAWAAACRRRGDSVAGWCWRRFASPPRPGDVRRGQPAAGRSLLAQRLLPLLRQESPAPGGGGARAAGGRAQVGARAAQRGRLRRFPSAPSRPGSAVAGPAAGRRDSGSAVGRKGEAAGPGPGGTEQVGPDLPAGSRPRGERLLLKPGDGDCRRRSWLLSWLIGCGGLGFGVSFLMRRYFGMAWGEPDAGWSGRWGSGCAEEFPWELSSAQLSEHQRPVLARRKRRNAEGDRGWGSAGVQLRPRGLKAAGEEVRFLHTAFTPLSVLPGCSKSDGNAI